MVVPQSSLARLRHAGLASDATVLCPDYPDDYLGQQVTKLYADEVTDADFICHVDSDCIFRRPTSPLDLVVDGQPIVLMEEYSRLSRHVPWRSITERFLDRDTPYEFMRQPPYVFPRWLYPELRRFCVATHGLSVAEYVLAQPSRGFSEFNALGGFAWHRYRGAFTWIDLAADPPVDPWCRVFWSRLGVTTDVQAEISLLLRDAPDGARAADSSAHG